MQPQNPTKTSQLKDDQEECELKLEKERDIYASMMFELLAEEESISNYIINYIKYQELCYKSALSEIEGMMVKMNELLSKYILMFSATRAGGVAPNGRSCIVLYMLMRIDLISVLEERERERVECCSSCIECVGRQRICSNNLECSVGGQKL
jgi:hypothetical protein